MRCPSGLYVVLLGIGLAGCAPARFAAPDPDYPAERNRSRVVVLESSRSGDMSGPTRRVARRVSAELALRWFNLVDRDLLLLRSPDLDVDLTRTVPTLQSGGAPPADLVARLADTSGVGQVLLVDVFQHEQVWGREARVTRVGVVARLIRLADGHTLWEGRCSPEVVGARGSGVEATEERAARELVRLLQGEKTPLGETPIATWPVLEYVIPE